MSLQLNTPPAAEPVTLAEAKAWLRVAADYGQFAPLALWGVKDLRARVAALEAAFAALGGAV